MSVNKLPDGRWIVQYPNPDKKKQPRLVREYFGRGAEAELHAIERNRDLGLSDKKISHKDRVLSPLFSELANAYLESRVNHIQPSTLSSMLYRLASVINPAIGALQAVKITPNVIDAYVRKRLTAGRKRSTVHRELSDIMAILNWSVKRRLLLTNPLHGYEKPSRDDAILQPPSISEVRQIIANAPPHLVRALTICYYTGLRPGKSELLNLTWREVDFETRTIMIRSAKKGGLKFRQIPLGDDFLTKLVEWKGKDNHENEIIQFHGKPIKSLKKSFATAKTKAGITRRIPMYSFRHAFATVLLQGGADLKATSELMGHSRPDTTMRIYQHTQSSMYVSAINKIESLTSPVLCAGNPSGNTAVLPENDQKLT